MVKPVTYKSQGTTDLPVEYRDEILVEGAARSPATFGTITFSIFETVARRRHFAYETLARYISKTVRARASKFGSFVEGIDLYVPDFFQIFPAKIVRVGIIWKSQKKIGARAPWRHVGPISHFFQIRLRDMV